jgi:hypothetical protein
MTARFSCFKNFRQYENLHTLIWIAKDWAWITYNVVFWFMCFAPAVLVASDFVYISVVSRASEDRTVKCVHFVVVLVWVIGNSVWALGDLFVDDYDDPLVMWRRSADSLKTARWYSSWVLFADLIPIVVMYSVWITLTYSGRLSQQQQQQTIVRASPRLGDNSNSLNSNSIYINGNFRQEFPPDRDYISGLQDPIQQEPDELTSLLQSSTAIS